MIFWRTCVYCQNQTHSLLISNQILQSFQIMLDNADVFAETMTNAHIQKQQHKWSGFPSVKKKEQVRPLLRVNNSTLHPPPSFSGYRYQTWSLVLIVHPYLFLSTLCSSKPPGISFSALTRLHSLCLALALRCVSLQCHNDGDGLHIGIGPQECNLRMCIQSKSIFIGTKQVGNFKRE